MAKYISESSGGALEAYFGQSLQQILRSCQVSFDSIRVVSDE